VVDKRCDPEVGDFGDEFGSLLEVRQSQLYVLLLDLRENERRKEEDKVT